MFKTKLIAVILAVAVVFCGVPTVYADDLVTTTAETMSFMDMPEDTYWSAASLNAAVQNGLLNGFAMDDGYYIKPSATLTRAQMATIVNRSFGATVAARLTGVVDVPTSMWFAQDMAKAVQMGTFMLDTKMRPDDSITRQEAFVVLSRAFKLKNKDSDYKALNKFSDKSEIESWALPGLNAMTTAGYVQGNGGKLNPNATITREEFAKVMDNLVKQYIDEAGTYTSVVASGNVVIRVSDVTLKGLVVNGDLIVADGVGTGDATFENIKVVGRAVIRGGGENSIIFRGSATDVPNVVIARGADGVVRILTQDGAVLAEAEVASDGNVILDGAFGNIDVVSSDITITLRSGTTVNEAEISGQNVAIVGEGALKKVKVVAGGNGASINTPNTVTEVGTGVTGVKAGGKAVPAGTGATNNATGTGSTPTTPPGGGGGGGGGGATIPTPVLSITEVSVTGTGAIPPIAGVYTIPPTATKNNTAIEVSITNTTAVDYSVEITIKNGATVVSYAESSGLEETYLELLSGFSVTFDELARLFQRLGNDPSGYYLDAGGNQINGDTEQAFRDAIDAMFARIGPTDVYTVTVKLTPQGGTAGTVEFEVRKPI